MHTAETIARDNIVIKDLVAISNDKACNCKAEPRPWTSK